MPLAGCASPAKARFWLPSRYVPQEDPVQVTARTETSHVAWLSPPCAMAYWNLLSFEYCSKSGSPNTSLEVVLVSPFKKTENCFVKLGCSSNMRVKNVLPLLLKGASPK